MIAHRRDGRPGSGKLAKLIRKVSSGKWPKSKTHRQAVTVTAMVTQAACRDHRRGRGGVGATEADPILISWLSSDDHWYGQAD